MRLVVGLVLMMAFSGNAQVDYHNHIEPIIQEHCISCHSKGKVGPMELDSYENVSAFASMIAYVTSHNIMPPWRASEDHLELSISKPLSEGEVEVIRNWIAGGLVEGANNDQVKSKKSTCSQDSIDLLKSKADSVENKTVTLKVREPFVHRGDYEMHQRVYVVPTFFETDIYVSGIEFVPGNSKIVLGCDIAVDTKGLGRKYDTMDPRSGYANITGVGFQPATLSWYSWSPDDIQHALEGYKVLPAKADLLFYIQYAASTTNETDQSEIKLTYSEVAPQQVEIMSRVLIDTSSLDVPFLIPANSVKHVRAEYEFNDDVMLMAIRPFGQLICEKWEIFLIDKEGRSNTLLEIEDWQFKWQRKFNFTKPLLVSKGSKIIAKATYINTIENIDIPIFPTKKVAYGEGLNQELFMVSFDFAKMRQSRANSD